VSKTPDPDGALGALRALHALVDAAAGALFVRHAERTVCRRGCSACCVDNLTVFEVEAERIRRAYPKLKRTKPHAPGACALLDDDGACRVYNDRPYVCRTQGLPLAMFEEDEQGEVQEHRSICELNLEGEPLDELDLEECWLIGPMEIELQNLQARYSGGGQERVALSDLVGPR
jgi:Fe-S-cluster containining protein